jgi:hypothetical protein
MVEKEIDRKIAVIFATDVVGYSKLMEKDEDQTIKTIRACREILENLFNEHGGRTFNTAGDSVLAEFSSAAMEVESGNLNKAKEYFDRGKQNGARGKWIYINLGNTEAEEKLRKILKPLGSLD